MKSEIQGGGMKRKEDFSEPIPNLYATSPPDHKHDLRQQFLNCTVIIYRLGRPYRIAVIIRYLFVNSLLHNL